MRRSWLHIFTGLLLLNVFLYIQAYLPYTVHVHIINGVRIVHAHPFSGDAGHTHTSRSLAVIDMATHQPFVDAEYAEVPMVRTILLSSGAVMAVKDAVISVSPHVPEHRGPPSFSVCGVS